jgi:hypothetical protein
VLKRLKEIEKYVPYNYVITGLKNPGIAESPYHRFTDSQNYGIIESPYHRITGSRKKLCPATHSDK